MDAGYQILTVQHIREEAPEVRSLVLRPAPGETLPYQAGQYLTLVWTPPHGAEIRRSYSFSSTPALGEPPTITVKRVDNGALSRLLVDNLRVGDTLKAAGTGGFFVLPDQPNDYRQLVLLAAGSGITPLFSLLKTTLHVHPAVRVLLIYSSRTAADTIFHRELRALARQFPDRFHLELLFSHHNPDLYRAHLHRELLEELVARHAPGPPLATLAYLCGPLNYMRMGTYGLHHAGLPLANIRRELFTPAAVAASHAPAPPDTDPHDVTLVLRGETHHLAVQYPRTILQAAKQAGLRLPYSCEAGQCGNCAVRCTAGTVWMRTNEVLTDRETSRGLVLTCTGYPVGGDVRLEL